MGTKSQLFWGGSLFFSHSFVKFSSGRDFGILGGLTEMGIPYEGDSDSSCFGLLVWQFFSLLQVNAEEYLY